MLFSHSLPEKRLWFKTLSGDAGSGSETSDFPSGGDNLLRLSEKSPLWRNENLYFHLPLGYSSDTQRSFSGGGLTAESSSPSHASVDASDALGGNSGARDANDAHEDSEDYSGEEEYYYDYNYGGESDEYYGHDSESEESYDRDGDEHGQEEDDYEDEDVYPDEDIDNKIRVLGILAEKSAADRCLTESGKGGRTNRRLRRILVRMSSF